MVGVIQVGDSSISGELSAGSVSGEESKLCASKAARLIHHMVGVCTPSTTAGVFEELVLLLRFGLVTSHSSYTGSVFKVISGQIRIKSVIPVIFDV